MLTWGIIITGLAALLIFGAYANLSSEFALLVSYLVMLASMGIFYRVLKKMREDELEKMQKKIKLLRQQNEELKLINELEDEMETKD